MILTSLADVDGIQDDPAPVALVTELGVSTVDLTVMFWTDSRRFDSITTRDAAIRATKAGLDDRRHRDAGRHRRPPGDARASVPRSRDRPT